MSDKVTRRGVLGAAAATGVATVAAAGGAGGLAALAGCGPEPGRSTAFDPKDFASVKAQFDLDPTLAHFAAFVLASHPAPVRDAITRHRAGLDRDPSGYLAQHEQRLEEAVAQAAAGYLQTRPDQIAFTDSTTMGLGLLYTGLRLAPGDEVLTTEHDFYATHEALRLRAARDGVAVRRVRLYTHPGRASVDEILAAFSAALAPRVRLVAVTWVHSGTGVKLPIRAIAELIRARNGDATLLCVDGVHGVGVENDPPDALGADFVVTGCHKWLFGPRGTGLIWGSSRGWDRFTPVIPTFERAAIGSWITGSALPITPGAAATPGGYHSFEHRWALAEAFGFHTAIGRARVAQRTRALADRLRHGLAGIDGVTVHTPRAEALSSAITCCELRGVPPNTAVARLRAHNVVASVTPYATELLRFGPSLVTDERDVDRALAAVRQLVG